MKVITKTRVFIVDDHSFLRKGLASIIDDQHDMAACGEASDPETALDSVTRLSPDVAIIDLRLMKWSGVELIQQLRVRAPAVLLIAFSMQDESDYAPHVLQAGASAYVEKSTPPERIIDAIRAVIKKQVFVSRQVNELQLRRALGNPGGTEAEPFKRLSRRQLEVASLIGTAATTREIAERLGVSIKTVEAHRSEIKRKLGTTSTVKLLQVCVAWLERNRSQLKA